MIRNATETRLAVFDFDGTLIKSDSMWLYLKHVAGPVGASLFFLMAVCDGLLGNKGDLRTRIKTAWIRWALSGRSRRELEAAALKVRSDVRWLAPQKNAAEKLAKEGVRILVATGALEIYMRPLLAAWLPCDLIAVGLCFENDVCKGEMLEGNTVRELKRERVAAYIKQHGPFSRIIGYGNAPHDLPMLELCDEKHVV